LGNERIHEALRVHSYTLQEVGDAVGLHYSTVSRIAKHVAEGEAPGGKSPLRRRCERQTSVGNDP
jgi:DNA-directed RNA polymerase specialized sigma54-like protein